MNSQKKIFNINNHCRICLIQSDNLISMNKYLDVSFASPTILEYLKQLLNNQLTMDSIYPKQICSTCVQQVKLCYDFQNIFLKSQNILERYIALNNIILPEEHLLIDYEDVVGHIREDLTEHKTVQQVPGRSSQSLKVELLNDNQFVVKKVTTKPLPKCRYCHKRFPTFELVRKHLISCKLREKHRCDYCSCQFPSLSSKSFHIRRKHSEKIGIKAPEFKCDVCNEMFQSANSRNYHKLTRHNTSGKTYTCEICGKSFLIKNSFNQHMEVHNKDVSKVICPICGKGFHYRGGLFYHMKVHKNERNYICSFCDRRFLNMTSLKRHTRTHTGERPYVCSFCPKSFCSISEVRTHERRHTGTKPHACKYCGKGYITLWNLRFHMASHSGHLPCDFCKRMFLNADVLKLHMEFKHKEKVIISKSDEDGGQHFEDFINSPGTEIILVEN